MIVGIIVIAVIVIAAVWFVVTYNSFVKLSNNVDESFATMDVYLKKRFDLIPNLVETVKGYASHEKEVFDNVAKARSSVMGAKSQDEKIAGETHLGDTLKSLFAVAEAYPELKANENFNHLMSQLEGIEADIANSRKYFNAVVKIFNIKCQSFPSSIVASMLHYTKRPMFEVKEENERENIKVDFGNADQ